MNRRGATDAVEMDASRSRNPAQLLRDMFRTAKLDVEVRCHTEAEEPILAPFVRSALFSWMAEIRAAGELKAAGLKPRNSALLFGPPGCGKTTLAHHLAARLGIPMVCIGSETLIGGNLGASEKSVSLLFAVLENSGVPCVAFIDELDGIGTDRSKQGSGECAQAMKSTIGVLLRKFEAYSGYFVAISRSRCRAQTNGFRS